MDTEQYVLEAVMTMASAFAAKGIEVTFDKAKDLVQEISETIPGLRGEIDVDQMAQTIQAAAGPAGRVASSLG
jgi:hypothetical protein